MKKINAGVIAGFVVLLFALVIFFDSFNYAYLSDIGPGPGFFPIWLSGILIILSLIYIVVSFKNGDPDTEPMPDKNGIKKILFIIISMILFALLLPYAGFIMSSTIFLFVLLYGGYKWYTNAAISAGVSILLFCLFDIVLEVQLPVSLLGW